MTKRKQLVLLIKPKAVATIEKLAEISAEYVEDNDPRDKTKLDIEVWRNEDGYNGEYAVVGLAGSPYNRPTITIRQWGPGEDSFFIRVEINFEESGGDLLIDELDVTAASVVRLLGTAPRLVRSYYEKG